MRYLSNSAARELSSKRMARTNETEARISADDSRIHVWVIPTNEELIVARQTRDVLQG